MKFVLASYGTRGDIEPSVAVGRELLRRGHEVWMAVPPNLVAFAESAGLATVAYGPDTQAQLDRYRDWGIRDLPTIVREAWTSVTANWAEVSTTLTSQAEGADLLLTGMGFQQPAANVAEYYNIPLVTLHFYPFPVNSYLVPFLPSPLIHFGMAALDWLYWRWTKKAEDAQRRELGLPEATCTSSRRIIKRDSFDIQGYDEVCFPGLAAEWAKWGDRRPFVGTPTMELGTDADDEVASWIAAGTPPIYFGFGSTRVECGAATIKMINSVCEQLGERALVCSGWSDFGDVPDLDHTKVVRGLNYGTIFPACRAVVHHGGAGTTAAGLRAGVPTLVLWTEPNQPFWGVRIKRLKVGSSRRFSDTTGESLVADLRQILAPEYVTRARTIATQMTNAAESVTKAADILENCVRDRIGPGIRRHGQNLPDLANALAASSTKRKRFAAVRPAANLFQQRSTT